MRGLGDRGEEVRDVVDGLAAAIRLVFEIRVVGIGSKVGGRAIVNLMRGPEGKFPVVWTRVRGNRGQIKVLFLL